MSIKRIIALLLCVAMLTGLCCVSALADEEEAHAYDGKYTHYAFFGDSIPAGVGMEGEGVYNFGFQRIEGAYPDLVADALGFNGEFYYNASPCATFGFRTGDLRMLLERGMGLEDYYKPDDYYYHNWQEATMEGLTNYWGMGWDYYKFINQWTKASDLITVGIGSNDIFTIPVCSMLYQGKLDLSLFMGGAAAEGGTALLSTVYKTIAGSVEMIGEFLEYVKVGCRDLYNNYPKILDAFQQISPDADILIMGLYNPFVGLKVTEGSNGTMLLDSMSVFVAAVNDFLQSLAARYDNVYYVDVSRTESQFGEGAALITPTMFATVLNDIHPSVAGHEYTANQILSVLEKINACPHEHAVRIFPSSDVLRRFGIADKCYCFDCHKVLLSTDLASLSVKLPLQNTVTALIEMQLKFSVGILKTLASFAK